MFRWFKKEKKIEIVLDEMSESLNKWNYLESLKEEIVTNLVAFWLRENKDLIIEELRKTISLNEIAEITKEQVIRYFINSMTSRVVVPRGKNVEF